MGPQWVQLDPIPVWERKGKFEQTETAGRRLWGDGHRTTAVVAPSQGAPSTCHQQLRSKKDSWTFQRGQLLQPRFQTFSLQNAEQINSVVLNKEFMVVCNMVNLAFPTGLCPVFCRSSSVGHSSLPHLLLLTTLCASIFVFFFFKDELKLLES